MLTTLWLWVFTPMQNCRGYIDSMVREEEAMADTRKVKMMAMNSMFAWHIAWG